MISGARRLFIWLALALALAGAPARAETVDLTPRELLLLAGQALRTGRPQLALDLSNALLTRDPDDFNASLIRARALRDLGQFDPALASARHAWALADTGTERFAAAMIMAQVQSSRGNKTAGQLWLRRAAQHAQTDAQRAVARRDFQWVKASNPWSISFSFGANPSSNINGGSSEDTITLYGLPFTLSPDAKALSGYQAVGLADISYRIGHTPRSLTRIGLSGYGRWNRLSAAARAAAPGVSGADFNYQSLALVLRHERRGFGEAHKLRLTGKLGRSWYGGARLADFASLGGEYRLPLKARRDLTLTLAAEATNDTARTGVLAGGIGYLTPTSGGHALRLSASHRRAWSDNPYRAYGHSTVGLDFFFAKPVLGADLSLGATIGRRNYAASPYDPVNGRHDWTVSAQISARLSKIDYYGFSPVVTLSTTRTTSNVALFTSRTTSLQIGVQSNF